MSEKITKSKKMLLLDEILPQEEEKKRQAEEKMRQADARIERIKAAQHLDEENDDDVSLLISELNVNARRRRAHPQSSLTPP